jgi:pyridoxine kinase
MQPNHNHQKKIALVNDFTGFGRCSLTVALPIISAMKVQCCPIPASVFSNHTGFESYFYTDYTMQMVPYLEEWKKLSLSFSCIATGFLGSAEQIEIVTKLFEDFGNPDTLILVDPVMGDYGKPYPTYTPEMCAKMKQLVGYADILTPNLTEACILTDTPYHGDKWKIREIQEMAEKLSAAGPQKVIITGIPQGQFLANYCYEAGQKPSIFRTHKIGESRSGTGDIFSAILAADAVNGIPLKDSVRKASRFIKRCILRSSEMEIPLTDGVCFEEVLYTLIRK